MTVLTIIGIYLAFINLFGLFIMFLDKSRAKRQSFRVPESTLFTVAIFGGSVGTLAGMYLFRHKTLKPLFFIGMPAILITQVLLVLILTRLSPLTFTIM